MNIEDLTIKQAKDIANIFASSDSKTHSLKIEEKYLIRTVTMMYTGKLIAITDSDLLLEGAAWIADSGRYADALENGVKELNEVEPYPNEVIVSRSAIVDAAVWRHSLPREQK